MVIQIKNYINGSFVDCKSNLEVYDYTGKNILANVPDAGSAEIRKIRRSIDPLQEKIKTKTLDERIVLLKNILKDYLKDKDLVKKLALLRGTPLKHITLPLARLQYWLDNIDEFFTIVFGGKESFEKGIDIKLGKETIGKKVFRKYEPTFIGLSGNMDGFEQFFVLAQGILAGSHMIVRASSRDFVSYEFFRLMDKHGYPEGGQLVTWNSKKDDSIPLVRMLLSSVRHSIMFGSNKTVNSIIYEYNEKGGLVKDYTEFVNMHKYGSGLPVVIVTKNADLKVSAQLIIEGAIDARGSHCISTTPVFVEETVSTKLLEEIQKQVKKYTHKEPTDITTDFGAYSSSELKNIELFCEKLSQHATKVQGTITPDSHSANLIIFDKIKMESNILREEVVGTVIGLIPYTEINEVIDTANSVLQERGLQKHLLAVVHGTEEEYLMVKQNLNAHVVRWNVNSADLNPFLPHQGSYFILNMVDIVF